MRLKDLFNYDFESFTLSLKLDFWGAIYEVLIRRAYSHVLRKVYGYEGLPNWLLLFRSLIRKSKFLLMVLDGARYDTFNAIYAKYLRGRLYAARVPPPHTYGWLPRAFSSPEFNNVRVFYARLMIRSHNIMIDRLVPKGRNLELISIRPRKMRELGTVLPSEVNEEVFMVGLSGRDIIWYLQPHFPWIYDLKLSKTLMREVLLHDFVPPDIVANKLKKLDVSRKRLVNIYHGNLILALKYVSDLLNYVKDLGIKYDAMVVTSDHGELLGEYGLYMHPHYELPQLCIVPWLEVEDRV